MEKPMTNLADLAATLTDEQVVFLINVLNRYTEGPVATRHNLAYFAVEAARRAATQALATDDYTAEGRDLLRGWAAL